MRHGAGALDLDGEERVRGARGWPIVFVGAEEPDGVGGEAGGLCRACDLDWRVAGFGRVEGLIESAGEDRDPVGPADAAAIEAEGA